jgi:hypothetical protein
MKSYSTHHLRRAASRRFRKPLSRREVRALLSAADGDSLDLALIDITAFLKDRE